MRNQLLMIFILLWMVASSALSDDLNVSNYFKNKSGCFILFDVSKNKVITEYNATRCTKQISPDSTFKIPLSLIAFNQKIITQSTIFKWDGKDRGLSYWNQDQTPKSWLKNSAVWVSQSLTPKVGMNIIKDYLRKFDYGNQDFSGDAGKNNGLNNAWLNSSLKISAKQQLNFLNKLVLNKLPVSKQSMLNTKLNMYIETSSKGWELYGKTGTGNKAHKLTNQQHSLEDGWFVGYVRNSNHIYTFVLNFSDLQNPDDSEPAGIRAKNITKILLQKTGVF